MSKRSVKVFKFSWPRMLVILFVVAYLIVGGFGVGGYALVNMVNSILPVLLSIVAVALALILYRQREIEGKNRRLWLELAIGWACWAIADGWWAIASALGADMSYGSGADVFWLAGYFPIYLALWRRARSLPKVIGVLPRMGIWVASLFFVVLSALFVFAPVIQEMNSWNLIESLLDIWYPLADVILLILALHLFFFYQRGIYGQSWLWIAIGFVMMAVGDLVFSFAVSNDLYYPNQQINFISTFASDVPYTLSYLFWVVGLSSLRGAYRVSQPVTVGVKPLEAIPNTHIAISTRWDNLVLTWSRNYSLMFLPESPGGKRLSEALGITSENENAILHEIKLYGRMPERAFMASTRFGQQEIWLSGIAILDPQQNYSGVFLLARCIAPQASLDETLSEYDKEIVHSLLIKTGLRQQAQQDVERLLITYYQALIASFYNHALREGGIAMAEAYLEELRATARQRNWPIEIGPQTLDISNLPFSQAPKVLPNLLETAKQFISRLSGEAEAEQVLEKARSQLGEWPLRDVIYDLLG